MLEHLEYLDERLLLYLNERHNAFFDVIMYWASDEYFWIPFYAVLAVLLFRRYRFTAWYILVCIAMLMTASDQLSSHLIKNWVRRLRPSHVPWLVDRIHLSKAGPGGLYGFVSSHAANSFALATFLVMILPSEYKKLKYALVAWALLVSYSRIYNGVHYPADVIGGAALGVLLGLSFVKLFQYGINFYLLRIMKADKG
jgi:undecaprenyl-diphosphatase